MDDLVTWLRAQLDDDERVAREADDDNTEFGSGPSSWTDAYSEFHGRSSSPEFAHVLRHSPARVLAEVDAKRRILDEHSPRREGYFVDIWCKADKQQDPCSTLRLLALPYADRPGYRDEWRPEASRG